MEEDVRNAIKTLIFTILVPGTVAVALPLSLLQPGGGPRWGGIGILGVLMMAVGATFYSWCAWDFSFTGQGTPAPIDPPKKLVARGLYRRVRNPMYLGVLLVGFGECFLFGSLAILRYMLVVALFFHVFVIFYEEPTLKAKFGADYEDYCKTVGRWTPRLSDGLFRG